MMPPSSSTISNIVTMITLVLSTLLPGSETMSMANATTGICCGDRGDGSPKWYIPPFSSMDSRSRHLGMANSTGSSKLLLLLVSLPSRGDQPANHRGSSSDMVSKENPPSWKLCSVGELASSYPFGLNKSLDLDFVGYSRFPATAKEPQYKRRLPRVSFAERRKLLASHDSTTKIDVHRRHRERVVPAAAIAAISTFFLSLLCSLAGLLLWCTRNKSKEEAPVQHTELCPLGPRRFSHRELAAATCGFAEEAKIGRGGFGPVYRGYLRDQDCQVAIKVLSQESSVQGMKEFAAEVKVMTRLRHRNIIQLLGWCDGPRGLLLVYEFMPNGSLDKALYDPRRLLTWSERYRIALGLGSSVLYLHMNCEQCVVHGDIKPANIMLDSSYNAKLGDFGLARLVDHGTDSRTTQVVAGTVGYIDPEFVNTRRPSAESDVYSFGVVLLEIACGKRPASREPKGTPLLLNWVRDMYRKNLIVGVADRRLDGEFDEQQMRRVLFTGLWCTHHDQSQRPSIVQAMDVLQREDAELPVLPAMRSPGSVRSLAEIIACGNLSAGNSSFENSSVDTAYHTSKDSTSLVQ